ncbi:MAG: hypothetical protein ABI373_10715 [Flavobacteriales bacterium]
MKKLFSLCTLLLPCGVFAQPFLIGTTSLTFHDDARNRDIACSVYYPALVAGADQALAAGSFSSLVIGHGFVMTVNAYAYLGQHYAAKGYIVVLPTTEGGLTPDHASLGQDLAFLPSALQALSTDPASPFYEHVGAASVLMGHSMGGGAALLAASNNTNIQAVVVLAPAETTPSAITACVSITVPTLIFGASEDCITPIATNSQPMYDATTASCKAFVDILGGGHCYFADASTTCSFGDLTCGPNLTIDRAQQHQAVLDVTDLWLDHFIGGSDGAQHIGGYACNLYPFHLLVQLPFRSGGRHPGRRSVQCPLVAEGTGHPMQ